eukprot:5381032-Amphidinium_carterae.1
MNFTKRQNACGLGKGVWNRAPVHNPWGPWAENGPFSAQMAQNPNQLSLTGQVLKKSETSVSIL